LLNRIGEILEEQRLLLVLDNLEHLLPAAPQILLLLQVCPHLTILATSRVVLRISGEQVFAVLPLALPDAATVADPAGSLPSPAVDLFVQRARLADPTFAVTPDNLPVVADVVRRLDGLPLAIELAAARVRSLSLPVVAARLSDRMRFLTGGARDLPARQRTIRDTIAWSHDLLTADERMLFSRFAVFAGGATLEAVEAIMSIDVESDTVLDLVGSLVDQSLIHRDAGPSGEPRYLMLETVRELALELLNARGEAGLMLERHASYFVEFAEANAAYPAYRVDAAESAARLDPELDNFRAALAWSLDRGASSTYLRLAVALSNYWALRGLTTEARGWLDRALTLCESAALPLRAAVVAACGWIARHQGHYDRAEELGERALALTREFGDPLTMAGVLTLLGWVADEQGRPAKSRSFHEEALLWGEQLKDPFWAAWSIRYIGKQAFMLGEIEAGEQFMDRALAIFRREGHSYGIAVSHNMLAEVALTRGEYARAAALRREWLDQPWDAPGLRFCQEGLINVAVATAEWAYAARLLGAAETHRARLGVGLTPRQVPEYERNVAAVTKALGPEALAASWAEGRRLSFDEARAQAYDFIATVEQRYPARAREINRMLDLTSRESDVMRLVMAGQTNRQIADALYISLPTVKRHLTNIFGKLDVTTRGAAVAAVRRRGLT
jgi:predicted ATPase/DNA-binding CsgD family transcriptional regulator